MELEKILESPLDSKELKSVNPKGNQPWIFIVRTDAGKDWRQEEKRVAEWESQVLGRLIRSPGPRGGEKGLGL